MSLYTYDQTIAAQGFSCVCGVDEAGRGPLAGPVYAAAVILSVGTELDGLNDSKKLTEKKRDLLFELITQTAIYAVASASEAEIDALNILQASLLAMRRAVAALSRQPDYVLVDGNCDPGLAIPTQTVIKGDGTSACIAAASILAKVARDRYLLELDKQYPLYQFAKHKGYPTKLHYELLDIHGASNVHRQSFLKKWHAAKANAC